MSKWTFIFLIFFLWHQEKNMLILYSKYGLKMNQFQELHFLITAKNLQLTLSIQSSSCGFKVELPRQLWLTLHSSAGVCTDGWLRFLQLITMTNESCDMHFFPLFLRYLIWNTNISCFLCQNYSPLSIMIKHLLCEKYRFLTLRETKSDSTAALNLVPQFS